MSDAELKIILARLEERITQMQEKDAEYKDELHVLNVKLDSLKGNIIKHNSDIETDIMLLKQSLKRKISDSIEKAVSPLRWASFPARHPKFTLFIIVLFGFSLLQSFLWFWDNRELISELKNFILN